MATLTRRRPRRSHSALAFNGIGTGNVTDLTRGTLNAAIGDDGLTNDLSTGIWSQGSGNLVLNGGFTTNTTGWATGGTNTIARSTVQAKFGVSSLLCTYSNDTNLAFYAINLSTTGSDFHAVSVWFYVPTTYDGTVARISMEGFVGATGDITADANLALRDQWQRVQLTFTPAAGDLVGNLVIRGDPTAGKTLYIDGVQIEASSGSFATPYVETDGVGLGADAAEIRLNAAGTKGLFTPEQGWVAVRVRMGWASADQGSASRYFFSWNTSTTNCIQLGTSTTQVILTNDATAGAAAETAAQNKTWTRGQVITVIGAWTKDNFKVSADGAAFTASGVRTEIPDLTNSNLRLGLRSLGAGEICGDIFWAAMGSGLLTNADAAKIHAFGNNKPDWFQLPGHPTGFWDGTRPIMTKIHG